AATDRPRPPPCNWRRRVRCPRCADATVPAADTPRPACRGASAVPRERQMLRCPCPAGRTRGPVRFSATGRAATARAPDGTPVPPGRDSRAPAAIRRGAAAAGRCRATDGVLLSATQADHATWPGLLRSLNELRSRRRQHSFCWWSEPRLVRDVLAAPGAFPADAFDRLVGAFFGRSDIGAQRGDPQHPPPVVDDVLA